MLIRKMLRLVDSCRLCCRQLLENLGFFDALPPELLAEPSILSSVDANTDLEGVHLQNAGSGSHASLVLQAAIGESGLSRCFAS